MSDTAASWITLSALFASVGWYVYTSPDRSINSLATCFMTGVLCLFGGFLFSGAIMKVLGGFESAIIPAILVCVGTAGCVAGHTAYQKKRS